jgi:hypothetical protein
MEIHHLKDVSDDILNTFDKMLNRDCEGVEKEKHSNGIKLVC